MYETDGPMECIQSMLYPVHDAENKLLIQPPNGVIVTSETQKLILSDAVRIPFFGLWFSCCVVVLPDTEWLLDYC